MEHPWTKTAPARPSTLPQIIPPDPASAAIADAELMELIAAWDTLPAALKSGIVAMIRASVPSYANRAIIPAAVKAGIDPAASVIAEVAGKAGRKSRARE